jgi:tetratricopeptide (TPR) repeat protein
MRVLSAAVLLVMCGCASAPVKKADLAALADADALVLQGCYDCLLEARAVYDRVAVGKARPLVLARLFETQLLVALRERELAIDATQSWARAQALAAELPPLSEANRYVSLAGLVPADFVGTPRRETFEFRRANQPSVAKINDELAWLRASATLREPARQYLSLAVDCSYLARVGRATGAGADDLWTGSSRMRDLPPDTIPLVAYRAATCDSVSLKTLANVRAAVPRFVETSYFVARIEVAGAQTTGGRKARELVTETYARFPKSTSVTYLTGNLYQIVRDCRQALRYYDETLALKNLHEDALLGRTMCLTFLSRHEEAIAAATHMIDLRTDNWGRAFYWRAWNHHYLKQLTDARSDIDRAKPLAAIEEVYTLAGIIEHDQDDLGVAETDLLRAKSMNRAGRNCTAMWYLGLVKLKREAWIDSARNFNDAMGCYEKNVKDDEAGLAALTANTDLDPEFKASQTASFETQLKEDRSQYYAAAFNAANQFAHAGNVDLARRLLDIAAKDPALGDLVGQLRDILK